MRSDTLRIKKGQIEFIKQINPISFSECNHRRFSPDSLDAVESWDKYVPLIIVSIP